MNNTGLEQLLQAARKAKPHVSAYSEDVRNCMLEAMAKALEDQTELILQANEKDMQKAPGKVPAPMLDRLRLDKERVWAMAEGVRAVAQLPGPLEKVDYQHTTPEGLAISRVRVPMGVVAIVYESRPNVTSDAAALCLKSGNVCVLRGGSDALHSNKAIADVLRAALQAAGGTQDALQFVDNPSHKVVDELLAARGFVDLLIPRGGAGLIQACVQGARGVPVVETGTGICHIYVDKDADVGMALEIVDNAKISRPSVCNSAEVCLVHNDVAVKFLPMLAKRMQQKNVQLRLDDKSGKIIAGIPAQPSDFDTEFLDCVLAVAVVEDMNNAIEHINAHSTGHSEAIVTSNENAAQQFLRQIDSAAVYWNASTRFTDGGVFGFGCEMGISTQKLGARGPMGLAELTSCQYRVVGSGQVR